MGITRVDENDRTSEALLLSEELAVEGGGHGGWDNEEEEKVGMRRMIWWETKKLWYIAGPSMFSRLTNYSMNLVTQAFAGHYGEVELAAVAIAISVIAGFNFGLMIGMGSALETLCGQAFGAKRYDMLGIYLQRSIIVLFLTCFLFLPLYIFATPILKLLGQPDDVAELAGKVSLCLIPLHFSYAFICPLTRFFQSQLKTPILAYISLFALIVNLAASWVCVYVVGFGVLGLVVVLDLSWWLCVVCMIGYATCGGCPLTWTGFSGEAFFGLWEYTKLSVASGVMICLENWYYKILILMTGHLHNSTLALDALTICTNVNTWEFMIHLAFFAATGVRVANELGAGNWKAAKFATKVAVSQSGMIGVFFSSVVLILRDQIGYVFTSSTDVIEEVGKLSYLLALAILLNSVQPILSGVAVGSGWQAYVAYINLGCYYFIGLPIGLLMGWFFNLGVMGIWGGMIFGGTAVQTTILAIITIRCDWKKEAENAKVRVNKWSKKPNREEEGASES